MYKVTNTCVNCVVWLCKSNDSQPFCRVLKVNNLLTFCTLPRDATCGCVEVTNRNLHFFVHFRELWRFPRLQTRGLGSTGQKTFLNSFGNVISLLLEKIHSLDKCKWCKCKEYSELQAGWITCVKGHCKAWHKTFPQNNKPLYKLKLQILFQALKLKI